MRNIIFVIFISLIFVACGSDRANEKTLYPDTEVIDSVKDADTVVDEEPDTNTETDDDPDTDTETDDDPDTDTETDDDPDTDTETDDDPVVDEETEVDEEPDTETDTDPVADEEIDEDPVVDEEPMECVPYTEELLEEGECMFSDIEGCTPTGKKYDKFHVCNKYGEWTEELREATCERNTDGMICGSERACYQNVCEAKIPNCLIKEEVVYPDLKKVTLCERFDYKTIINMKGHKLVMPFYNFGQVVYKEVPEVYAPRFTTPVILEVHDSVSPKFFYGEGVQVISITFKNVTDFDLEFEGFPSQLSYANLVLEKSSGKLRLLNFLGFNIIDLEDSTVDFSIPVALQYVTQLMVTNSTVKNLYLGSTSGIKKVEIYKTTFEGERILAFSTMGEINTFSVKESNLTEINLSKIKLTASCKLTLERNPDLSSIILPKYEAGGLQSFVIQWNPELYHLVNLDSYKEVDMLTIENNTKLPIVNMQQLTKAGNIYVRSNMLLTEIYMPNLVMAKNLWVHKNPSLVDINFSSLQIVTEKFSFMDNTSLLSSKIFEITNHTSCGTMEVGGNAY